MTAPFDQARPSSVVAERPATQQMREFINGRFNFERLPAERYDLSDFKLSRMRELLARLGDPQFALPAVHIAGTKGKGSTAAMTAAVLSAAGYRVGLFTSPHVADLGERMTVDGVQPTDEQLRELMAIVPPVVAEMDRRGPTLEPTFFECITAMAWVHFLKREVDLVVLEVGLGGRLDATNVCTPLVTAITNISHDHERLLGGTLAQIAAEKAGIIKPSVPVLSGVTRPEPGRVIRETAARCNAPCFELERDFHYTIDVEQDPLRADATTPQANGLRSFTIQTQSPWGEHRLRVPLLGRHQARNALLAVSICDLLACERFPFPAAAIDRGFVDLHWPLRIEVLRRRPLVIADAAHNDDSIDSLIDTLATVSAARRRLVFATSKDKRTADLLSRLNAHFDEAILTQYVGNPRSVPLDVLESIAAECLTIPYSRAATPQEAWQVVSQRADPRDLICATGSFFIAAEIRAVILEDGNVSEFNVPQSTE